MPNSAQPTNSIDSELVGFFKPYLQPKNVIGSHADTYTITAYGITQALQAIHAKYISRKEVEEVLSRNMTGFEKGGEIEAVMNTTLAKINQELRAKLLQPTKGEKE